MTIDLEKIAYFVVVVLAILKIVSHIDISWIEVLSPLSVLYCLQWVLIKRNFIKIVAGDRFKK